MKDAQPMQRKSLVPFSHSTAKQILRSFILKHNDHVSAIIVLVSSCRHAELERSQRPSYLAAFSWLEPCTETSCPQASADIA